VTPGEGEFLLDAAGVRAVDAELEAAGLLELAMEEAGRAVALAVQELAPGGPLLLLAGGGANGGDAYVAARHLIAWGRAVRLLGLPVRHPLTRANRARLRAVGGSLAPLTLASLTRALEAAPTVVDGLLGTGFTPPLREPLLGMVRRLNAAREERGLQVVAIDLPSGLDAGSALAPGEALGADHTVTLGGPKPALLYGPAAEWAGKVRVAGLGVPSSWLARHRLASRPEDREIALRLPQRSPDAHKGTAGWVWIIGGHPGTVGAPILAGIGALRAGAGLVTLYSPAAELPALAVGAAPELMARHQQGPAGMAAEVAAGQAPDALALGMGLGPQAPDWAREALSWGLPTVLDADALQPELAGSGHERVVWTPHPGEAARLLGCTVADITRGPPQAARELQRRFGGVVVLKGGPSTVAGPDGLFVSRGGHPGMASAGMGDTLGGVIAALLGQRLGPTDAAICGVRLHARAGELAGARHGYGLTATDVSLELGAAWADLRGSLRESPS